MSRRRKTTPSHAHDVALHGLLTPADLDEIAETVVEPLTEHVTRPRKESRTRRVLSILDELEKSRG